VVQLYERGHHEVLGALLAAGFRSDGALSEMLGDFYGEVLTKSPSRFIAEVRRLDAPTQKEVCWLAGSGDGGGMAGDLDRARRGLKRIGDEVALRCLREVEEGNRASDGGGE
jgi:hypothetical protein